MRDDARHGVLEGLREARQLLDAGLDDLLAPLVDLLLLVDDVVGADDLLDGGLRDLLDLLRVEVLVVRVEVVHLFFILFKLNLPAA